MSEMMGKHLALKDKLPPFTLAVWCAAPYSALCDRHSKLGQSCMWITLAVFMSPLVNFSELCMAACVMSQQQWCSGFGLICGLHTCRSAHLPDIRPVAAVDGHPTPSSACSCPQYDPTPLWYCAPPPQVQQPRVRQPWRLHERRDRCGAVQRLIRGGCAREPDGRG